MAVFSFRRIDKQWLLIITICFAGLFVRTTDGVCSSVANCDVCADTNVCTICSSFYGLTDRQPPTCQLCSTNSGCSFCTKLSLCDVCNNTTLGPDTKGVGTCSPCPQNCRYCVVNGAGLCDSCNTGYGLNINNTCTVCAQNCSKCAVNGAGLCDSCNTGYGLNINNTCTGCSDQCATCSYKVSTNVTSLTCDRCLANDHFVNATTKMCQLCTDVNCIWCTDYNNGLGSFCNICNNDGFYLNNTYSAKFTASACPRCAASCRTCSGPTAFNCNSCISGFAFASGSSFCAPINSWVETLLTTIATTSLIATPNETIATPVINGSPMSMSTPVINGSLMSMSTPVITGGLISMSTPVITGGLMSMSTPGTVFNGGPMSTASQPSNSGTMTIIVIIFAVLLGLALIGYIVVIVVIVRQRRQLKKCHQNIYSSNLSQISVSKVNDIIVPPYQVLQYIEGSEVEIYENPGSIFYEEPKVENNKNNRKTYFPPISEQPEQPPAEQYEQYDIVT